MLVFVFAALLALATAQCDVQKNTYAMGSNSITFGAVVGDWMPVIYNMGDVSKVYFSTWTKATVTRMEALDVGTTQAEDNAYCALLGQYNIDWSSDCSSITFNTLSDSCRGRHAFLEGNTFTAVSFQAGLPDCVSPTSVLETRFQTSESSPRLSEEPSTIVFGNDQFAVVSVGSQAALFQRWKLEAGVVNIIDLASSPAGLSCHSAEISSYNVAFDGDCAARFCGGSDNCKSRAELFHQAPTNSFGGDNCVADFSVPDNALTQCNTDGRQWLRHPWDCTDQPVEGGCMFCKGIAKGEKIALCLNREGGGCNQIFASPVAKTFCNLEFECPASTFSSSLFVFICALVAMFFYH